MRRVRIVCKAPPQPPPSPEGVRIMFLPDWSDCRVYLVDDDDTEREIPGLSLVAIECKPNHLTVARLELEGVELDMEAVVTKAAPP